MSAPLLARCESFRQAIEKLLSIVKRFDGDAFVPAVCAVVVYVVEDAGDAVDGDAGLPEEEGAFETYKPEFARIDRAAG
ncbi:MAG TPA: hypothetical protein VGB05_10440 [Pyrinomonadaceae bacterium]